VVTEAAELAGVQGGAGLGPAELLDVLATVTPSRLAGLAPGLGVLSRAAGEGPVVALLGAVGPEDAAELARVRSGPTADLAVLVDVGSWADADGARRRRPVGTAARAELTRQQEAAADLLRAAGWQVTVAGAAESVADAWARVARPTAVPGGLR